MLSPGVHGDVRADLSRVDLDRSAGCLVSSVGGERRVFDKATRGVADIPSVNAGALLDVWVERQIRIGCPGDAFQDEPVDVSPHRVDRYAGVPRVPHREPCPRERPWHRIGEDAVTVGIADRPAPNAPTAGVAKPDCRKLRTPHTGESRSVL